MRTLLIFLSIGLFLTLIQYSTGISRKSDSSESVEGDSTEMKDKINLQSISDSNDESDEIAMRSKFYPNQFDDDDQSREEKIPDIEAVERLQNPEESNIHSVEHDHNDDDGDNNDYYKILRDSDED